MKTSQSRRDQPDILAGAVLVFLGGLGFWGARDLSFGTAARMGAGFLPDIVCVLLVVIGAIVLVRAFRLPLRTTGEWNLRPLVVLAVAMSGFSIFAENQGFIVSSVWLLAVASFADPNSRWREVVVSTLLLTLFGALVFIYGLGVNLPILPF